MHGYSGEHMYSTVFLDITTIFNYNPSPVSTKCCARSYIHIFTNNDISCDHSLRMYKCTGMNYWDKTFKTVYHIAKLSPKNKSMKKEGTYYTPRLLPNIWICKRSV